MTLEELMKVNVSGKTTIHVFNQALDRCIETINQNYFLSIDHYNNTLERIDFYSGSTVRFVTVNGNDNSLDITVTVEEE